MNLSQIFRIFRRRWPFMVIPAAIVLGVTILTAEEAVIPPSNYNVGVRFLISPPLPTDNATAEEEERYYQWLTSEYLTNGMADWANGIGFAEKVSAKTAERGFEVDPLAIFNGTSADAIRSRLTIIMNYGDRDALQAMIEAAIEVLEEENGAGIPHLGLESPAEIVLLDRPVVNEVPASIGNQLDLPVRIVLAVITGLLIGFLVEYFDPYVRDAEDVRHKGLQVLAQGEPKTIGRDLRAALLLQNPVPSSVVIGGTAGTTFDESSLYVAYELAAAMANSGRKTILVDGVLSNPLMHTVAKVDNQSGFADSLVNNAPLRLQETSVKNLSVLAGGSGAVDGRDTDGRDLAASPNLPGVMARLKQECDMLIVVAPPPKAGFDAALLGAHTDGVVMHVERGLTWFSAIEHGQELLDLGQANLLGTAVT